MDRETQREKRKATYSDGRGERPRAMDGEGERQKISWKRKAVEKRAIS